MFVTQLASEAPSGGSFWGDQGAGTTTALLGKWVPNNCTRLLGAGRQNAGLGHLNHGLHLQEVPSGGRGEAMVKW